MRTLPFLTVSAVLHGAVALAAAAGVFGKPSPSAARMETVEMEILSLPAPVAPVPVAEPAPVQARRVATVRPRPVARPEPVVQQPPPQPTSASPLPSTEPDAPAAAGPELATSEAGEVLVPGGGLPGGIGAVGSIGVLGPGSHRAAPSDGELDDLAGDYLRQLNQKLRQNFVYPRRARRAGLQGRVVVEVRLDGTGSLVSLGIYKSSGHDVLDTHALESVRSLVPFPPLPAELRQHPRPIRIPVDYSLMG